MSILTTNYFLLFAKLNIETFHTKEKNATNGFLIGSNLILSVLTLLLTRLIENPVLLILLYHNL